LAMALPNPTSCLIFFCFSFYLFIYLYFFFCAPTKQLSTSRFTQPWPFLTWLHLQFYFYLCIHQEILNSESCSTKAISNLTLCSSFFVFQKFHAFIK
jgi:hypothetical protein